MGTHVRACQHHAFCKTRSRTYEKSLIREESLLGNRKQTVIALARDRSLKSSVRNGQLKRRSHRYLSPGRRVPISDRDGRSVRAAVYDECEYRRGSESAAAAAAAADSVDRLALHSLCIPHPHGLPIALYRLRNA